MSVSDYAAFFLNSSSAIVELETIDISHPDFTQPYRIVRNAINGIMATLETGETVPFTYYPVRLTPAGASDDLEQKLNLEFGDLGEIVPTEVDFVRAAGTWRIKPTLIYRTYRSDVLTAPMWGPFRFIIDSITFNKEGALCSAGAPRVNVNRTGEVYTIDRFPMLNGFL